MSIKWGPFEHAIWKNLNDSGLEKCETFLLSVSGGLDSIVLLDVMLKIKPHAEFKIFHYHHGPSADTEQYEFRNKCADLVSNTVLKLNSQKIKYFSDKSLNQLDSEELARLARWDSLNLIKKVTDIVITGHHLDDQVETILLKLIRGTSIEGLSAFKMWNQMVFRPFINFNKSELLKYAQDHDLVWFDDPSNQKSDYLRNWVRNEWLQALEIKKPGARENLARSLVRVAESAQGDSTFEQLYLSNCENLHLSRSWFLLLPKNDQLRTLALYLKAHSIYNFTSGQLEEIRKRLDKNQKDLTFELLEKKWVINATHIVLV